MRLFVSVEPSPEVREWARSAAEGLKPKAARLRWLPPENAHWTLAFLGEQPEERLPAVREAMERAAEGRRPFSVSLGGLGAFSSWRKAKVVWVGLSSGERELVELAHALEAELRGRGFALEDREFSAHLTLARAKAPERLEALEGAALPPRPSPSLVTELALMRSRLEPKSARYERLWGCPLRG